MSKTETKTETTNDAKSHVSRADIIRTVQTPLGFFVLVVLVVEVIFGVIAGASHGGERVYLIAGMIVLIFLLVGLVAFMAIWRPESLQGIRPKLEDKALAPVPTEVLRMPKPKVLCACSSEYEQFGFDQDIATFRRFFKKVDVEYNLTSGNLRRLLTERQFDIIHLLSFVEPKDGALVLSANDKFPFEGFTSLLEVCQANLLILTSCDSLDLAAKASRKANTIAATTVMKTDDFIQWAECFYSLLSRGHALSRAFDIARTTTNAPMVLLMKHDVAYS